jgi:KUP system potassium uptake protein
MEILFLLFCTYTGIAVVFVMALTSAFLVLIMIMIWKSHILLIVSYVLVIGTLELLYLSSVLYKFDQGGYLPLAFAAVLMSIMYIWNDVHRRKYFYELNNKVSLEKLNEIGAADTKFCRLPGLALFYSELVQGIPPIFKHYVANVPAMHSTIVFVSIKSLPISKVAVEERFLFRRVELKDQNVFRCVVRYGYTDRPQEQEPLEEMLVERLKEYIVDDFWFAQSKLNDVENDGESLDAGLVNEDVKHVDEEEVEREIEGLDEAWRAGVVHLIGENEVVAGKGAGIGKRFLINYAYNFLRKNLSQTENVFDNIPRKRMLKVGMIYEL